MGYKREDSLKLFHQPDLFKMMNWLTVLFAGRYVFLAIVKYVLIQKYGVEGYGNMIVFRQAVTWAFSILIAVYTYFIYKKIQDKTGMDNPMNPNVNE
ncbi:hypothetical protein AAAC51_10265 [Priestia megaterium]